MDALIEVLKEKRTLSRGVTELRQRLYLWRRFRNADLTKQGGVVTKTALAKALRGRITEMSKAEAYEYYGAPHGCRVQCRDKLVRANLRERTMIYSILTDMHSLAHTAAYLGVDTRPREPIVRIDYRRSR